MDLRDWDYRVTGYKSHNEGGEMLLQTVHKGRASMELEVSCWKDRIARGERVRFTVEDLHQYKFIEV